MAEDEGGEEVDDVGAPCAKRHRGLVEEDEEGDGGQHELLVRPQLLEYHVQQAHVQGEVHVIARTVRRGEGVEAGVLPQVALRVAVLE